MCVWNGVRWSSLPDLFHLVADNGAVMFAVPSLCLFLGGTARFIIDWLGADLRLAELAQVEMNRETRQSVHS